MTRPRKPLNPLARERMTEAIFGQRIAGKARAAGWLAFHDRDSRGNEPGWPDWVFVGRHGGPHHGRLVIVELKMGWRWPTATQSEWLDAFSAAIGKVAGCRWCRADHDQANMSVLLWRPSDVAEINAVLGIDLWGADTPGSALKASQSDDLPQPAMTTLAADKAALEAAGYGKRAVEAAARAREAK